MDGPLQVAIAGGNDAHINLNSAAAAQRFELVLLKDPQQFDLRVEGEFADFIEKKAAAVGQFKPPNSPFECAGECSLHVTEKFAFDKSGGNRAAIHFYQRAVLAFAAIVNRAGN